MIDSFVFGNLDLQVRDHRYWEFNMHWMFLNVSHIQIEVAARRQQIVVHLDRMGRSTTQSSGQY